MLKRLSWLLPILFCSSVFGATVPDNLNAGIPVTATPPLTAVAGTIVAGDGTSFKQTTTPVTPNANANVIIAASAAGKTPLQVMGAAGAVANIFQVCDSTGRVVGACQAGSATASGANVTIWGDGAGASLTTANNTALFGTSTGSLLTTAPRSSMFGSVCGVNATGNENSLFGYSCGTVLTSGTNACLFGAGANVNASSDSDACAFGHGAVAGTRAICMGGGSSQATGATSINISWAHNTATANDLYIGTGNVALHNVAGTKTMSLEDGASGRH